MEWELKHVEEVECQLDNSGVHVVINRIVERRGEGDYIKEFVMVRADVMTNGADYTALVSFQGSANAVRKHLTRWLWLHVCEKISTEHASYIGYELLRAETTEHFIQD